MASSPDFVEYVCFQLRHAGEISFKKMFGEYGLYCDRKYFGLVGDNQLFVKVTAPGLEMLPEQEQGSPYPGAKPHFLMTELDDDRALSSFVRKTCSVLSAPDVLSGGKRKKLPEQKETGVCDACLCRKLDCPAEKVIFRRRRKRPGLKGIFSGWPPRSVWLRCRTPRICPQPVSGI